MGLEGIPTMSSTVKIFNFCFTRIPVIKNGKAIDTFIAKYIICFKILSKTYSPKPNVTLIPI